MEEEEVEEEREEGRLAVTGHHALSSKICILASGNNARLPGFVRGGGGGGKNLTSCVCSLLFGCILAAFHMPPPH